MTEPDGEQKYYKVIAPMTQIRPLTPEEIAGVPHSVDRSGERPINNAYLYYSNKVPTWAHEIQIRHQLENYLIAEVSAEEYMNCTAEGEHCYYDPTPQEVNARNARIINAYT